MAGRSGQAVSPGAAAHCNRRSTGPKTGRYAGLSEGAGTVRLHGWPAREEHHALCSWLEKTGPHGQPGQRLHPGGCGGSFVCVAWIGCVRFISGCFGNNQCGKLRLIFGNGSCHCQASVSWFGFHLCQKCFPQRLLPAVVCGAGNVVCFTPLFCSLSTLCLQNVLREFLDSKNSRSFTPIFALAGRFVQNGVSWGGYEEARRASLAGGMGKRYARNVNQTKAAATASIITISAPLAKPFVTDVSQCSNSTSLRRASRIS